MTCAEPAGIFFIFVVVLHLLAMSQILLRSRKLLLILAPIFLTVWDARGQQVPSPEQFLGYPLGSHFTVHERIAGYFRQVARLAPDRMLLKEYGKTYAGRPLLLAFIASPDNLKRLDAIRLNHLRLAGLLHDGVAAEED